MTVNPAVPRYLAHLVDLALEHLPRELQPALRSFYGLGVEMLSPAEIGRRLDVSAARVKADRNRGVRLLRHPSALVHLKQVLRTGDEAIWSLLAEEPGVVLRQDPDSIGRELPGPFLLALDTLHESVTQWLSSTCKESEGGWYRGAPSPQELGEIEESIARLAGTIGIPRPLPSIAALLGADARAVALSVVLGRRYLSYRGYVVDRPLSTIPARAVRAHRLLRAPRGRRMVSFDRFFARYQEDHQDDPCTANDLVRALRRFPFLFLPLGDDWVGLGPRQEEDEGPRCAEPPAERLSIFFATGRSPDSAASQIKEIVAAGGPMRLSDIGLQMLSKSAGAIHAQTTQTLVANDAQVVRLAPGVYDLRRNRADLDPLTATSDLLLTEGQCRQYVMSRFAGEPYGAFPLWTPAMEQRWCRWAREAGPDALFESLLFVCAPERWPATAEEVARWTREKQARARYHYAGPDRYQFARTAPSLPHMLATLIHAREQGWVGWSRANRLAGHRLDSRTVDTGLATLVALRALRPEGHVSGRHVPGLELDRIAADLEAERHLGAGGLSWSSPAGRRLAEELAAARSRVDLAPLRPTEVAFLAETVAAAAANGTTDGGSKDDEGGPPRDPEGPEPAPPDQEQLPFRFT